MYIKNSYDSITIKSKVKSLTKPDFDQTAIMVILNKRRDQHLNRC